MNHVNFYTHLNQFILISESDFEEILIYFEELNLRKKHILLEEGKVCDQYFFVLKGILRKYYINDKGSEQTIQFAIENWWMTEDFSLITSKSSEFYIQTVEKTDLLIISKDKMEKLCLRFPILNIYFKTIYQKAYAASQMRMKLSSEMTREQFFWHFNQQYPAFLQRIPQYMVASFLGFTPEYLSEIRKKGVS